MKKYFWRILFSVLIHTTAQAQADYTANTNQLITLISTTPASDRTALKNNPKLKELISKITDQSTLIEGGEADPAELAAMIFNINKIIENLIFFGIDQKTPLQQMSKESQDQATSNMLAFISEIESLEIFHINCNTKIIKYIEKIIPHHPDNSETATLVSEIKFSTFQLFTGSTIKLAAPIFPIDYKINISKTLAETAPIFASTFNSHQRDLAQTVVTTAQQNNDNPQLRDNLNIIVKAFKETPCSSLCNY